MTKDKVQAFKDRYWDELSFFPWVVMVSALVSTVLVKALGL